MTFDIEYELQNFDMRVRLHGPEHAEEAVRRHRPDHAEAILAEYRSRLPKPTPVNPALDSPSLTDWYVPDPGGPRWQHTRSSFRLPDAVVDRTSEVSDDIVRRLANPRAADIRTRGLVLGHVQSGKTTNFLAVAAKAADAGYDLIIVLAGVHNSLRRQTQKRAANALVDKRDLWWLGTEIGDFSPDGNPLGSHLAGDGKRGLLVVKKNRTVLKKLADWLHDESDASLRRRAILIIDDEADQAGLDVSKGSELEGVHEQLRRILDLQTADGNRRCAYLAYTATPYANILTSQDQFGLYPRDFIYPLEKPTGYVGAQEFFGNERVGHPIRIIDETESEAEPSDSIVTGCLDEALRWFVLATAARVVLEGPLETFHSSMLIHTTARVAEHVEYRDAVERHLRSIAREFESDEGAMREQYERTLAQVPARPGGGPGTLDELTAVWDEVRPHVLPILRRIVERDPSGDLFTEDGKKQQARSGVIADNGSVDSPDRLTYSDVENGEPSVTAIVIGGNTLSRGLTLEGLVCSYFARTANNYDTLMQMGRWFGFRPGYRHLVRVWTTGDILKKFQSLDDVEQDLRSELMWMIDEGWTPDEYGPRIRVMPALNITRAPAIKSVRHQIDYTDSRVDLGYLDLMPRALENNQATARKLASAVGPFRSSHGRLLFTGVPAVHVKEFIKSYRLHTDENRLDKPSLEQYLNQHPQDWNILFKSLDRPTTRPFDFGGAVGAVTPVVRSRLDRESVAFIQSVVDPKDLRVDMDGSKAPDGAKYRGRNEPPLLIVYAIDPESRPAHHDGVDASDRLPLDAPTHPISFALALPASDQLFGYVTPSLPTSRQSDDVDGRRESR